MKIYLAERDGDGNENCLANQYDAATNCCRYAKTIKL